MKKSELLLLSSCFSDVEMDKTTNNDSDTLIQAPTSQQKWWASVLVGFIFFILASAIFIQPFQYISDKLSGPTLYQGGGHTIIGLIVCTIIFILIIRLILG